MVKRYMVHPSGDSVASWATRATVATPATTSLRGAISAATGAAVVAIATTAATLATFAAAGGADGFGVGFAEFLHGFFTRQLDAAGVVDQDHLDLHLIADVHEIGHAIDVSVGEFRDVTEAIGLRCDLDERAEFLDLTRPCRCKSSRPSPRRSWPR